MNWKRNLKDYGPFQLGEELGLPQWAIERAITDGLLAAADVTGGRWSARVVADALARLDEIKSTVGTVPDVGASRAADYLTDRFGRDVPVAAIHELSTMGLLPQVGEYHGHTLYDGRALERFTAGAALEHAITVGRHLTGDQAAEHLGIRRTDLDHLVRAGWLAPVAHVHSRWQPRRAQPEVPLYRIGDLDQLAEDPAIDWAAVRAVPKGARSPLRNLPAR
ncbi:hypothetical protein [Sciscionella sediminilitoris]|uniref:hypothetical protein n=1 Tax=Sciscionella sediminilitoris TaxID=1445613 RepID=UPI0004DF01AF|nr:hypothetical protein [Sciscionella sp. SE31]